MPTAVPAIIGGVTTLGGALIGSKGASNAAREQRNANAQAMALERERMAEDRRRYDQQYEFQMAQRRLRDQMARQILAKHGYDVPGAAASNVPAGVTGKTVGAYSQPAPPASLASISPGMGGGSASQMFDSQGGGTVPMVEPPAQASTGALPAGPSLGTLTNWSDELWRRQ